MSCLVNYCYAAKIYGMNQACIELQDMRKSCYYNASNQCLLQISQFLFPGCVLRKCMRFEMELPNNSSFASGTSSDCWLHETGTCVSLVISPSGFSPLDVRFLHGGWSEKSKILSKTNCIRTENNPQCDLNLWAVKVHHYSTFGQLLAFGYLMMGKRWEKTHETDNDKWEHADDT